MNTKRPVPLTIAIIGLSLLSLANLALLPLRVPPPVIYVAIVLGISGLVAAFGLWRLKRWGMILAIIFSVLNTLSAALGIATAPDVLKVPTALAMVLSIMVIVLVMLPSARKAYAAERARVTA